MQADLELRELINKHLKAHPGNEKQLAEMLQVSVQTIKRWTEGRNLPHLVMARAIIIFLNEKLQLQAE